MSSEASHCLSFFILIIWTHACRGQTLVVQLGPARKNILRFSQPNKDISQSFCGFKCHETFASNRYLVAVEAKLAFIPIPRTPLYWGNLSDFTVFQVLKDLKKASGADFRINMGGIRTFLPVLQKTSLESCSRDQKSPSWISKWRR